MLQLKQTGMSLEDIMAFTEDGCMLERLQQGGEIPHFVAEKRVALLKHHQQQLYEEEKCQKELEKESCVQWLSQW